MRQWLKAQSVSAWWINLLWGLPLLFLALFYFYPLTSILQLSFARSAEGLADPFLEAFQSLSIRRVLAFTLYQATLSTLLTLAAGLPGAFLLARYQFPGKSLLRALTGLAFVLPTLVVAAAFNALIGPRGWLNLGMMSLFDFSDPPLRLVNSLGAILLAHVFYNTTIVLRLVGDFWAHLDPRLGQAARSLGARRWQVLWHITLPLLRPALLAAALLIFLFDFTSFGVILVLGGPRFSTLEVEIYTQTVSLFNLPLAAALSVIQLLCTLLLTLIYNRLSARLATPLTLRPQATTQRKPRSWRSHIFIGSVVGAYLLFFFLPLIALTMRSITRLEPDRGERQVQRGLTLDFYRELSTNRRQSIFYVPPTTAIAVSLGYAAGTVCLSLALGLPAAWLIARGEQNSATGTSRRGASVSRLLDSLLMLPLGTSAVTLGLGFIVALDQPPLDLRTSPLLVPLAHTLVAFPFVVRSLTPTLRSIRPRLRQAAAVLGASPLHAILRVDIPIMGRAILAAAVFAFTISLGEFGATALLARPEFPTIPVAIYRLISQPGALNYGQALALSTLLMLVTASGMLAIERLRLDRSGEF